MSHIVSFLVVLTFAIYTDSLNSEDSNSQNSRLKLFSKPKSFRVISVDAGQFTNEEGLSLSSSTENTKYEPTWESLDSRPLPKWYDSGKIGIFIHWGVFSVPSFGSEWFWNFWKTGKIPYIAFMKQNYPPKFTYQDFGPQFTAEFFDPNRWAEIFNKSGAKYVVLTSKHHEGFTLWPSKYSFGWNAMEIGPKRDLVGQLATAIRSKTQLKFGLYHSLFEWFNPLFLSDQANNFTTNDFVEMKTLKELYEIVNTYKPEIIWSDGDGGVPYEYWKSREFLTWLYNDSPVKDTVVTNDRWGTGTNCKHGGYFTCNDRYNPGVLLPHKWENCMTLDKMSWGYRRNAKIEDYLTPEELIRTVVETISCGGNILINVGPTKYGVIPAIMEERLIQLGEWLEINGKAVYETKPWIHQNDTVTPGVWYTQNTSPVSTVYAIFLNWPSSLELQLGSVKANTFKNITLLGSTENSLNWRSSTTSQGINITLPSLTTTTSRWGWTLAIN